MQTLPTVREALFLKPLSLIPKHEKIQLLEHILDIDSKYLIFHGETPLSKDQYQTYIKLSNQLLDGAPLQYVTGEAFFFGHKIKVDSRVLIPRPETEVMVDHVIQNYSNAKHIVDIGAGSGAITSALAQALPDTQFTSLELCPDAIAIAKQNLEELPNVSLKQSDLLANLTVNQVDVICANLPYIGTDKFRGVDSNVVKYEPKKALFAGPDGLDLYRRLFTQIYNKNLKFRVMIIEIADGQANAATEIANLLLHNPRIRYIKDLNKKNRFLEIKPK